MVKNLAITGRRKLPRRDAYVEVEPKIVELAKVLNELSLSREQLVDVGIMIGTDFNPDGVKGIGPKTAVKLIRENGSLEKVAASNAGIRMPADIERIRAIRNIFLEPEVTQDYSLKWSKPDQNEVVGFLCKERDFSEERVRKALDKMIAAESAPKRSTLEAYFG